MARRRGHPPGALLRQLFRRSLHLDAIAWNEWRPEDFIAGESLFFRTHQWIVDVLPTDAVFESSGCGSFDRVVRFSPQFPESIPVGAYLVGSQVQPGTYRTTSVIGCRWARVRSFTGQAVDTIQGGFVSPFSITPPPSELIVTIEASDVGFKTYKDCGTWQRVS
jgi:hypothetical protein